MEVKSKYRKKNTYIYLREVQDIPALILGNRVVMGTFYFIFYTFILSGVCDHILHV